MTLHADLVARWRTEIGSELATLREAAALLRISYRQAQRRVEDGTLRTLQLGPGQKHLIPLSVLATALIEEH